MGIVDILAAYEATNRMAKVQVWGVGEETEQEASEMGEVNWGRGVGIWGSCESQAGERAHQCPLLMGLSDKEDKGNEWG